MAAAHRKPTPILKIYVWQGYADAAVIAPFESECQCYVSVHYMNTSDDLYKAIKQGDDYDVISASSDIAGDLVRAGLVQPLTINLIDSQSQLIDPLGEKSEVKNEEDIYGVPFMWGANVLIYNSDAFPQAPKTWDVLRQQRFRGKVAVWDDLSSLYMAELSQNRQADIYHLNDFKDGCQWFQGLTTNGVKLWDDETNLVKMFRTGQVVVAMGWPLTAYDLKSLGMPVEQIIPEQDNTTGWVDYLMIPERSKHTDLAYKLVKHLSDKRAQGYVARITHTIPANNQADSGGLTMPEREKYKNVRFWQALGENREKYKKAWEQWKRNQCPI
jgi:putative spermidine/putrescine transport system substrate-binding protein/spermidine/putrescine transport system substrate-binding protein